MSAPLEVARTGALFAAFAASGLAFGYFFGGWRWTGESRPSRILGYTQRRWATRSGIALWCACIVVGTTVAVVSVLVALVQAVG